MNDRESNRQERQVAILKTLLAEAHRKLEAAERERDAIVDRLQALTDSGDWNGHSLVVDEDEWTRSVEALDRLREVAG